MCPMKEDFPAFNIALGKTLIAAAWVDGELNQHEMVCLKNLILQFQGITFEDWRRLKIYLAYPVSQCEQNSIIQHFTEQVYSSNHRKHAWESLITVLKADGKINKEEKDFAEEMDEALLENSESFLRKLKFFLFKDSIKQAEPWQKNADSRDRFIHEFFDNPAYFLFRKILLKKDIHVPHSKPELQKICLYASILCWLSNADKRITLPELNSIRSILINTCGVSEEIAKCIQDVAFAMDVSELQLSDLVSSLRDVSTSAERNELFIAMTKLVAIDNEVNDQELESLRTIAVYLEISNFVWVNSLKNIVISTFGENTTTL